MANNLTEKVLSYIETSGEALGVAIKLAESQELAKEKVTGLISSLKTAGLIEDHQEKEASAQLVDPNQALDILSNVIDHYQGQLKESNAKTASLSIGEGDQDSSPVAQTSKHANFAGYRRGSDDAPAQSDEALLRLIDGYQPSI